MKKEGIQTRNRKLATKAKKKRGSVVDFFAPFEKSFGYSPMTSPGVHAPGTQAAVANAAAAAASSAQWVLLEFEFVLDTHERNKFRLDHESKQVNKECFIFVLYS